MTQTITTPINSLCLYCGSRAGTNPIYASMAAQFGESLAREGIDMVYGGGSIGLMGAAAQACMSAGGHVTGIIPEFLDKLEVGQRDLPAFVVVETMHERKWKMIQQSDGFVALPGGLGTLDELAECLTWKLLDLHNKPIFVVGPPDYWQPFLELLQHMVTEGFADQSALDLLTFFHDVPSLMNACKLSKS